MKLYVTLTLLFLYGAISAQTFTNVKVEYGIEHSYQGEEYGGGCSFHDFNRDGKEDISLASGEDGHKFYIATEDGTFEEIFIEGISGDIKGLIWVDYDNDGDADLSYAVYDGQFYLMENLGDLTFQEVDLGLESNTNITNNGISWADYDNDGYLDLYVARYNGGQLTGPLSNNRLIRNNGDGTFTDVTEEAGVGNDMQATFIGSWFDYNSDGLIDLHVVNDRSIYPNALYENNGDGTFTDVAIETSTDLTIDCMTSTVGDYNNDGEFDLYLSNGEQGCHLLNKTSNGYEDTFPNSGTEMYQVCWAGNWFDYDHNGWKDLHVCSESFTQNNGFFINNEGIDYTREDELFPDAPKYSFSSAKGDINNDGLYDLLVLNEAPYTSSLFLNNFDGEYQYVQLTLQGTYSNRDAIGTRLDYYINGEKYTEMTHAGTDYMGQDSQIKLLSIPISEDKIDSLLITWPRGLQETYYSINPNSQLNAIEGASFSYNTFNAPAASICSGELTTIGLAAECDSIAWNNGSTEFELSISEPGTYSATLYFPNYELISEEFIIATSPTPVIDSISVIPPLCFGDDNGQALVFSSSSLTAELLPTYVIDSLSAGNYFPLIEMDGFCSTTANFQVEQPSELFTIFSTEDPHCYAEPSGSVSFSSFGGTGTISTALNSDLHADSLMAGTYEFISTDENGCVFTDTFSLEQPDSISTEAIVTHVFCYGESTGSVEFISAGGTGDLSSSLILETMPSGLTAGTYEYITTDANGCSITDSLTITQPDSLLMLLEITNATEMSPGSLSYSLNGGTEPYMLTLDGMVISDEDLEELVAADYCLGVTDANECYTEECFTINTIISVSELLNSDLRIYPNPSSGEVFISQIPANAVSVELVNALGEIVMKASISGSNNIKLDVTGLSSGVYYLRCNSETTLLALKKLLIN